MLERNSVYKLNPNVVIHKNSSTHFWVFNTKDGSHYSFNNTSYWILNKLASGSRSFNEILREFLDTFQVDQECGKSDLEEICDSLEKEEIIVRRV